MSFRISRTSDKRWILATAYVTVSFVLGCVLPQVDRHLGWFGLADGTSTPIGISWSILSGIVSFAGMVFSLAFFIVPFGAAAYSPRVGVLMIRSELLSHALGVFSATFVYSLLALWWDVPLAHARVPVLSVVVAVLLLLASVGMFFALLEEIVGLQIGNVLRKIHKLGLSAIEHTYQNNLNAATQFRTRLHQEGAPAQTVVYAGEPLTVQAINVPQLVKWATACGASVIVNTAVGDVISKPTVIVEIFDPMFPLDHQSLERAFTLGTERTFQGDPRYSFRLLVDIAIRALSPAVNDPTTAVEALDFIEDLLANIGMRELENGEFTDPRGVVRVVIPSTSWEDDLRLALDEIQFYGASSVQVLRRILALLVNLEAILPRRRHEGVNYWKERVLQTIALSFNDIEARREASTCDRQGLGIENRKIPRSRAS